MAGCQKDWQKSNNAGRLQHSSFTMFHYADDANELRFWTDSELCCGLSWIPYRFRTRLHCLAGIDDAVYCQTVDLRVKKSRSTIIPDSAQQRAWDGPLMRLKAEGVLIAAQSQSDQARLIAVSAPHAGDFLAALPCSSPGTRMGDSSLWIAVALRFVLPVSTEYKCICGVVAEAYGSHKIKFKLNNDDLYSGVIITQLLRDRFTINRPGAEWRMQFLNEMAPLAALHITGHPMAVPRLTLSRSWYSFYRPRKEEAWVELSVPGFELRTSIVLRDWIHSRTSWRLSQLS